MAMTLEEITAMAEANKAAQQTAEDEQHDREIASNRELLNHDLLGVLAAALSEATDGNHEVANAATRIVEATIRLREHEANALPPYDAMFGGDEADELEEGPDDGPHALACRFTALIGGDGVGIIGGREFRFVRYTGWVDTSDAEEVYVPDESGELDAHGKPMYVTRYKLTGRAVSRYNDRVLVITDGGVGMVLPADLITLEADA